jgi:hypothetical protein
MMFWSVPVCGTAIVFMLPTHSGTGTLDSVEQCVESGMSSLKRDYILGHLSYFLFFSSTVADHSGRVV